MAKRSVTASRERTIHTHAELWHASRVVLTSGQKIAKGSVWQFLASAIFTAFAFEAYLNHVGPQIYARWDDVERLSPLAKLDLICHFLDIKLVTQSAELSAIKELFDFRNKIAHGRTRNISDTKVMRPEDVDLYFSDVPRDSWEKLIKDEKFAVRVRKHVETLANRIRPRSCRRSPTKPSKACCARSTENSLSLKVTIAKPLNSNSCRLSPGKRKLGVRMPVNKITWAQVGRVAAPGRFMFKFGWLTVTADELAIWQQFPDAAFTLVPLKPSDDGEEYRLGSFDIGSQP